jgi:hypothetical protein
MKKPKIFLLLTLLFFTMILNSCMFPGPGHVNNGGPKAPHHNHGNGNGNGNGNGHGNEHDNGHDKK